MRKRRPSVDALMTPREVAAALDLTVEEVRRLAQQRWLPVRWTLSGQRRFRAAYIKELAAAGWTPDCGEPALFLNHPVVDDFAGDPVDDPGEPVGEAVMEIERLLWP